MKTIVVLITVHNRKEQTLKCLTSLFNCILPEEYRFDVFLVDDGSTDGTSDAVKEKFPQVNIIQGSGNLFWNRGMHLAWETAAKTFDYDYYLWLNDDTLLYTYAIEELITCSESENNQKIICGSTCAINDKQKITYGGKSFKRGLIFPNGKKQVCDYFNGNLVLIPQYVYKKVGMNDTTFHHALGDHDYGLRAKRLGIVSIVSPSILGECDGHKELTAWCNPQTPVLRRLKLLYSPSGNHPFEFFKYENRHNGLVKACFHLFTNHLRAICPVLWRNK
ncbi:MAG: glycosyltransferase family 2 protein [Bacteroidales bacterium]|jgi:GT2 family glycosyltransferase|nr:glycosyltransferase family 2 protein [Bacteroidales bacterium]